MTQTEFAKIMAWSSRKLWLYCHNLTVKLGHRAAIDHLMKFRRELLAAVAIYSKAKRYDTIQEKALLLESQILRWCKEFFMPWATREVIRLFPAKAKNPDSIKYMSRQMWEDYVARYRY